MMMDPNDLGHPGCRRSRAVPARPSARRLGRYRWSSSPRRVPQAVPDSVCVLAATDEQGSATTASDSRNQLAIQIPAILTVGDPKVAKPRVETTAHAPWQKRARHPAPQAISCLLIDVLHPNSSEVLVTFPVR